MRHRVRAAALVFSEDRNSLLLVKHVHPETKREWWVPPGGGVEIEDRDLFQTAERETFEEAGIIIKAGKIKYIREFHEISRDVLHLELFVNAEYISGTATIENIYGKGEDEHFIKEAAWLTREQMKDLLVFPEIVHEDSFWEENNEVGIYLEKQIEDKWEDSVDS